VRRIEAEKLLLLPLNDHGAFMLRDSESRQNDYSLSGSFYIRHHDFGYYVHSAENSCSVRDGDTVKHYRIRQLDQGGFYIARRITFRTLPDLVAHYAQESDGLCVNLRRPCVRVGRSIHSRFSSSILSLSTGFFVMRINRFLNENNV